MANKETISFKAEMDKLNDIVDKISSKALPIEESLKLYEEGTKIIKNLEKALKEAEENIEKVIDID